MLLLNLLRDSVTDTSLLYAGLRPSMELPKTVSSSSVSDEVAEAGILVTTVSSLEMAEAGLLLSLK